MTGSATDIAALLFVYGTLRRGCNNDWARRLHDAAVWQGSAYVTGHLLRVADYPALILDPSGSCVVGDLFRLHDPAATLAMVDVYEECTPDFAQPWEYRRIVAPVRTGAGDRFASLYVYERTVDGLAGITSGDWLKG